MTVIFGDEKQNDELDELRRDEEEELVKILSDKYKLPYADLRGVAPEPDAMLLIKEDDARKHGLVAYKLIGLKLSMEKSYALYLLSLKNGLPLPRACNAETILFILSFAWSIITCKILWKKIFQALI